MSEELTTEELVPVPIEEQVSQELVKHNYTEAKLREFEEYLKLEIIDDDKESYLIVKDKRKEVKAYRVAVEKFCKFKREDSVKIQKAWVANENKLVAILSNVEDNLEAKEKAYEKKIAEEKEARKRKQEEQLIVRQQTLTNMGALYSDGNFTLGEVSYEYSLIKESDEDVWGEAILPKFKEEYEKVQVEQIEKNRLKEEAEAELKRQQEELEQKKKELAEEALRMKAEKDRQELEAAKRRSDRFEFRSQQLKSIGFDVHGVEWYAFREFKIAMAAVWDWDDNAWGLQLVSAKQYVDQVLAEEAEEKRKEQERKELQEKRFYEIIGIKDYGPGVELAALWDYDEDTYQVILKEKNDAFKKAEEELREAVAEKAAKEERERIEEEQRQAEVKRKNEVRVHRVIALTKLGAVYSGDTNELGAMSDEQWWPILNKAQVDHDELIRKEEEERKAEEAAKASEKVKWAVIISQLSAIEIPKFMSGQYAKKAAVLREKLEEIKAL